MAKKRKRSKKRRVKRRRLTKAAYHPADKLIVRRECYTKWVKPGQSISPSGFVRLAANGRVGRIVTQVKGLCTWCGESVVPPRSTWCSDVCVRSYGLTQTVTLRAVVEARDCAICSECGLDTEAMRGKLASMGPKGENQPEQEIAGWLAGHGYHMPIAAVPHLMKRKTLWDMDHIVPVSKGGDLFDIKNLHTLCYWCHKAKTKKEVSK